MQVPYRQLSEAVCYGDMTSRKVGLEGLQFIPEYVSTETTLLPMRCSAFKMDRT